MIIYFQLKLMKPKSNVVTIFCTAIMTKQNRKSERKQKIYKRIIFQRILIRRYERENIYKNFL